MDSLDIGRGCGIIRRCMVLTNCEISGADAN